MAIDEVSLSDSQTVGFRVAGLGFRTSVDFSLPPARLLIQLEASLKPLNPHPDKGPNQNKPEAETLRLPEP